MNASAQTTLTVDFTNTPSNVYNYFITTPAWIDLISDLKKHSFIQQNVLLPDMHNSKNHSHDWTIQISLNCTNNSDKSESFVQSWHAFRNWLRTFIASAHITISEQIGDQSRTHCFIDPEDESPSNQFFYELSQTDRCLYFLLQNPYKKLINDDIPEDSKISKRISAFINKSKIEEEHNYNIFDDEFWDLQDDLYPGADNVLEHICGVHTPPIK